MGCPEVELKNRGVEKGRHMPCSLQISIGGGGKGGGGVELAKVYLKDKSTKNAFHFVFP